MTLNRMDLQKRHEPDKWKHDVVVDGKEFYFIPRIFILRKFASINNTKQGMDEVVDIDMTLTPLYVMEGQEVTMRIIDGQFQIRVRDIQNGC